MIDPRLSFVGSLTGDVSAVPALIGGTPVRIVAGTGATSSFVGQVLTYQLSTLAYRLFDRVELIGDESAPSHPDIPYLEGAFLPALRRLLPTLRELPKPVASERQAVTIVVGNGASETGTLYLGASGWTAYFSANDPQPVYGSDNPLGALAAGAIGAAELFKFVFRHLLTGAFTKPSYALSLLDYGGGGADSALREPELPGDIDLDATLFGCGSIGCGLLAGLLLTPQLHGSITLVDNGVFDHRNPYKYSFIDWETGRHGLRKATWAEAQINGLANGRIVARSFHGTAEEYVASLPANYKIPLAFSAVDTTEARFQIQDTLPRYIVNAGIDGTSAEVSSHGFGQGPCLACLGMQKALESWNVQPISSALNLSPSRVRGLIQGNLPMEEEDLALIRVSINLPQELRITLESFLGQPVLSLWNRVAYSETTVQIGAAAPIRVTTAFVSAFAGVLMLAEGIKRSCLELQQYQVSNSYRQELLGVPAGGTFQHVRDKMGWCLCHSNFRQAIYRKKYETAT